MSDKITPRTQDVPIFNQEDWDRLIDLETEVGLAREADRQNHSEQTSAALESANAAYDSFYAEAAPRAEAVVRLRNVGGRRWREIRRAYPARDGFGADATFGFDVEAAFDEVLAACIIAPSFDSDAARDVFIDSIPWGQQSALVLEAVRLNQDARIPKAPSARTETSSAT